MLYGIMAGDRVMLVASEAEGRPVIETAPPAPPEGYEARMAWEDGGAAITQVWELVPREGTAQDAALTLAQIQASRLSDDDALKVPALYPRWEAAHSYAEGDRVTYQGKLYKALRAHLSAANERPCDAPSLYAVVLPSTVIEAPEWEGGKSYSKGDRVTKYGQTYESLTDGNTIEPGTFGSESAWKQLTA